MKRHPFLKLFTGGLLLVSILGSFLGFSGCSGKKVDTEGGSKIVIHYVLGHDVHALEAEWRGGELYQAQTLLDSKVVEKGEVSKDKYLEFMVKVKNFMDGFKADPADMAGCRNIFKVQWTQGGETRMVEGCRGRDDGALSRLVRDGEFLLYSKK